jgi:membrane fusion protein, multidrug efflux system
MSKTPIPRRNAVSKLGHARIVLAGLGTVSVLALVVAGGFDPKSSTAAPPRTPSAIQVNTAVAAESDVPVYLGGLGTVQAFYTATIAPRVDGQLVKVAFKEGQMVKQGDLLAQIDPRPYQASYDQAVATKDKDAANLANAQRDLERYVTLAPQNFTSKQVLDTQKALVAQLTAQVKADQASIDSAKTQLDYTTISSPIPGRTGIRLVDPGNNLLAAANTGIVVVTQLQPISLIFTLPEEDLGDVADGMKNGTLAVQAISRDGKTVLGAGTLTLVDNEIDQTTGTIKLKASFPNEDSKLWPGQFVNAKVLAQTKHNALTVPSAAIQRGPSGVFVYVVKPDETVEMRQIQVGEDVEGKTLVTAGLQAGERVTTSNEYRLQPGTKVSYTPAGGGQKEADAGPGAAQ